MQEQTATGISIVCLVIVLNPVGAVAARCVLARAPHASIRIQLSIKNEKNQVCYCIRNMDYAAHMTDNCAYIIQMQRSGGIRLHICNGVCMQESAR